jgi:hypothetical protein
MTNNNDIDTTTLDAAPAIIGQAHKSGARLYLVTTYIDGSEWHRTGRIGKTAGHKPAYLVMSRSDSMGSSDLLSEWDWEQRDEQSNSARTEVRGIKHRGGSKYFKPSSTIEVKPGRVRFTEPQPERVEV